MRNESRNITEDIIMEWDVYKILRQLERRKFRDKKSSIERQKEWKQSWTGRRGAIIAQFLLGHDTQAFMYQLYVC